TPCIFPLIPPYLAFIAGLSIDEINKRKTFFALLEILSFLFGISLIFLILGFGAGSIGKQIIKYKSLIRIAGGSLAILLGIQFIIDKYILSLGFKSGTKISKKKLPLIGSFTLGFAFGLGWSPCIGPILATILLYAASTENPISGAILLLAYALGFCIPFLITGLVLHRAFSFFSKLSSYSKLIRIASGISFIAIGTTMILS
ncbi:MAG: sulfite exporter TauE/SafE family protein, partial [Synergistetes bacterium]|nr:sulfite exporter TauE/SafE family protein [Synergistota bacterium]